MLVVLVFFFWLLLEICLVVYRGEREGVGTTTLLPVYLNVQARTYFLFLRIYGQNNSKNMGKLCMKEHGSIDSLKCCFRFYLLLQKQHIIYIHWYINIYFHAISIFVCENTRTSIYNCTLNQFN